MKKINLDNRLIKESLRIREEYLISLKKIKDNESIISEIKDELNESYDLLKKDTIDKEFIENKILNLSKKIKDIKDVSEPIIEKINKLSNDADKLFETIKEKNPYVTEKQLIEELSPHIKQIDDKFDIF